MTETQKLVSRILIRGKIEDVWREITKTEEPQQAFFNSRMHVIGLKPGSPIQMRSPDGRYTAVVGDILEVDPPRRLSHTMKFTAYDDPHCRVTYDLRDVEGGVEFTLTSEEVPANTKTARDMTQGGDFIVKTLKAIVETGRPPLGTRLLFVLFKALAPFNPKSTRSQNWPLDADGSKSASAR